MKQNMKARIWMEVVCDNCGGMVGRIYHNAKSVSLLKKEAAGWTFDEEHGNLCPECSGALRKEKKGA